MKFYSAFVLSAHVNLTGGTFEQCNDWWSMPTKDQKISSLGLYWMHWSQINVIACTIAWEYVFLFFRS